MALIECKECKNEISDHAKECPYCGWAVDLTTTAQKFFMLSFLCLLSIGLFLGLSIIPILWIITIPSVFFSLILSIIFFVIGILNYFLRNKENV